VSSCELSARDQFDTTHKQPKKGGTRICCVWQRALHDGTHWHVVLQVTVKLLQYNNFHVLNNAPFETPVPNSHFCLVIGEINKISDVQRCAITTWDYQQDKSNKDYVWWKFENTSTMILVGYRDGDIVWLLVNSLSSWAKSSILMVLPCQLHILIVMVGHWQAGKELIIGDIPSE
jgi:hypothetical protein